jgi:hypothetical protein
MMATYDAAPVADSVIAFKKGITLQQARQLRDNALAMFEGSAGAPRLQFNALGILAPGAVVKARNDGTLQNATTTNATLLDIGFLQNGTVRVTGLHRSIAGAQNSILDVFRQQNGVTSLVATWSTLSTSFVSRLVDVGLPAGARIIVQHRAAVATNTSEAGFIRIQTDGSVDLWPMTPGQFLEN